MARAAGSRPLSQPHTDYVIDPPPYNAIMLSQAG